jgi:hypothetical protein
LSNHVFSVTRRQKSDAVCEQQYKLVVQHNTITST